MKLRIVNNYIINYTVLKGGLYYLQLATTAIKVLLSQNSFIVNINFTNDI